MLRCLKYNQNLSIEWNNFLVKAKSATFLFNRNYMDYHSDKFVDHSLMIYNEKGNLICCFPANEKSDKIIFSHEGLTYGSIIVEKDIKLPIFLQCFSSILKYYQNLGFDKIKFKAFPRFYNTIPSDEIDYALFLTDAKLYRRDNAIAINIKDKINYSGNIRREANKAIKGNYYFEESSDFVGFWENVLIPNLKLRFGVQPVHSSEEIEKLKHVFPDFIKLYIIKSPSGEIVCGTVFYLTVHVAHCQYIASTEEARNSGALNMLFVELIDKHFSEKNYFDFGIVNEQNGKRINKGMLGWKERMGGRAVSHDFYDILTENFIFIEKLIK